MTKPMIRINTGSEVIDREMNAEELEQWQKDQLEGQSKQQAELAKAAKKAAAEAKLEALGLTSDDLKALGLGGN